jgi:VWFA-related protein
MRFICVLAAMCLSAQETGPRIRVDVNLVQVDAVVHDRAGRVVTDLTKDDFEVFEDGVPKRITNFSFVQIQTPGRTRPARTATAAAPALQRQQVNRTIALVVDDLKMSFASINFTRQALRKFVDEQLHPGDLAAVITTSGGASALEQFTTDKRLLHAAIDRIRVMLSRGSTNGAVRPLAAESLNAMPDAAEQVVHRQFAVGTLGTLRYISAAMRDMPGRKSLVLFSDGFALYRSAGKEPPPVDVDDARRVTNDANRSAVVIYTVDPRGNPYPGLQAADDTSGMDEEQVREALDGRMTRFHHAQDSLKFLANETGGYALLYNNDLNAGLTRMMEDQAAYYLLGFTASDGAKSDRLHRITVRAKRRDLKVQARRTYMGERASETAKERTPSQRLAEALRSPFAATGLHVRFTPMFFVSDTGRPAVRGLVHIDGADLSFGPPDADGRRAATVQIAGVAEGEDPKAGWTAERTYTIHATESAMPRLEKEGLVYALEHDIEKPGAYQMRVAVMDAESGRTGSASHFIEVPDVVKGRLAISGVTMGKGDWRSRLKGPVEGANDDLSPAVRIFERGEMFSYGVVVYNARKDVKTGEPGVQLQPRLIRGDEVVWEGQRIPVVSAAGVDDRRLPAGGVLRLGAKTAPGPYVLELEALDLTGKPTGLAQWIDFELR